MKITFELNGKLHHADAKAGMTLLEYLRSIQLYSVKYGCDHGECGACTVLINDVAINACLTLMHTVEGKRIETTETFSSHEELHSLQEGFLHAGAAQCGFCTPGMINSLEALDREGLEVNETAVRDALNGNLCRCTGYLKPVEAALEVLSKDKGAKS
jgi:aerobic-type carbon monoxide dehydrogenase small subunit (CoxS/CutS family)